MGPGVLVERGLISDSAVAMLLQNDGKIVVGGYTWASITDEDVFAARYHGVSLFGDGFESGTASRWSTVVN